MRQEGLWDYSRCRWLCSKVHISCKKAQLGMLKTSWKTRSYTRLLHWSLCGKKNSDGVQQCELLILQAFPNQRGHKQLWQGPHARLTCRLTPLSLQMKQGSKNFWADVPEVALQNPHALGKDVPRFGKCCAGCPWVRNSCTQSWDSWVWQH